MNTSYSSVDGVLFNIDQTTLIQCPGGKAGSYTIPDSVTNIGYYAFSYCTSLTSVTIGNSVTTIGNGAFRLCTSLTGVYFKGDAPSIIGGEVFGGSGNVIVYYLAGTTGWESTYGGRPTMLWEPHVVIITPPQSQTVVEGTNVTFSVIVTGEEPLSYQWRKEGVGLAGETNSILELTSVQTNQSGNYTVLITNTWGSVTSIVASLAVYVAGSIQELVNAALPGSVVVLGAGTVVDHVTIDKDLTLKGAGPNTTIIDGAQFGRVFTITSNATVTLCDLTIQNGKAADGAAGDPGEQGQHGGGIFASQRWGRGRTASLFRQPGWRCWVR